MLNWLRRLLDTTFRTADYHCSDTPVTRTLQLSQAYRLSRMREIADRARWHRQQMEGELQELCELCGTTADSLSDETDWCVEVIHDGQPVAWLCERMAGR